MKFLLPIYAFILLLSCSATTTNGDVISDTVKKDTTHKPRPVDSFYTVPRPIDSPYIVPRPVDSFYTVPVPKDSPYTVPRRIDSFYTVPVRKDSPYTVPRPVDSFYTVRVPHYVSYDSLVIHYINKDSIIQPIDTAPKQPVLFGVLQQQSTVDDDIAMLQRTGLKCIRTQIYFAYNSSNNTIDQYLQKGYQVQINFNYKPTATATPYPTDTAFIRKQARAFFTYYKKWIKQIPVVVCENEWDNKDYHGYDIAPYLVELSIVVDEGHKQGFLIADAGFTSGNLKRWIYSQLTGIEQAQWKEKYTVVINSPENPFDSMLNQAKIFLNGIKTIPIDYINVHWYNTSLCFNGLPKAAQLYLKACNKTAIISNEFGIKVSDTTLLKNTINELRSAGIKMGIAYSGIDAANLAVRLNDDQLKLLK
jgi:hypothetical protein